jgi:hypothetical protein
VKVTARSMLPADRRRKRGSSEPHPRPRSATPEGSKAPQRRAEQKAGAYKRIEVFLGVEAAIALRQLMRDGRSAREVIEELLLAEKRRKHGEAG